MESILFTLGLFLLVYLCVRSVKQDKKVMPKQQAKPHHRK